MGPEVQAPFCEVGPPLPAWPPTGDGEVNYHRGRLPGDGVTRAIREHRDTRPGGEGVPQRGSSQAELGKRFEGRRGAWEEIS